MAALPSSEEEVHALVASAVAKRALHIRSESQTITMANVRRLLESDLGLEKSSLDAHKAFIRQLVDEALLSSDNAADQEEEKAVSKEDKNVVSPTKYSKAGSSLKRLKKSTGTKAREESVSEELKSEDSQRDGDLHMEAPKKKQKEGVKKERAQIEGMDEDVDDGSHVKASEEGSYVFEAKKKKKQKQEGKKERAEIYEDEADASHAEASEEGSDAKEATKKKKQKQDGRKAKAHREETDADEGDNEGSHSEMSEEGTDVVVARKKKRKQKNQEVEEEKAHWEEKDEVEDDGSHGEAFEEGSDMLEPEKWKKAKAASVKSTTIDHLKKTIKDCGLGIPPNIYRKAKQVPDHKQEAFIIKELEFILSRHGLSSDPTEKEIKSAKRKIAREKDMEGIEMSNIITEPRGRRAATSSFFAPVYKPPPPVEYDSEEDNESGEDGDEGSEDDVNVSAEGGEEEEAEEAEESE